MDTRLQIVLAEEGTDPEHLDRLAGHLRQELLQLDVDDVTTVPGDEVPPGARGALGAEVGALLVSLHPSALVLRAVMSTVLRWWHSSQQRPSIRLVMDGDELEVSAAPHDEVQKAFELFISRHSEAEAPPP